MPRRRVLTPVEQLQSFELGRIVGLQEAGWTYGRIAAHVGHNVSMVFRNFQQWSVGHSHTRTPCSGRPHSIDALQDQRIVRAAVAARTASREEIRVHFAPAVSPRTIGNRRLAVDHLCLLPGITYTTTPPSMATVVS